jgi:demethylmenaquinone methyltransferase / 2-methoxy-6-polyprenyl-1,4-benzoquinol methylase
VVPAFPHAEAQSRNVPHSDEPLPVGAAKTERVRSMFDAIAPRYDVVNRLITFGLDRSWRRTTVDALALPRGALVLDLACGTGDLSAIARRRGYRTVGADLSWGMLEAGGGALSGLEADAAALPFKTGSLDGIVCGYALRNFTDLAACFAEAARVLRPGGRLCALEVAAPPRGPIRTGYTIWFEHVVPAIGAALSDRDAYRYLPRSTVYLPDEPVLRGLLLETGFATVGRRLLSGGLSQLITATRIGVPQPAEGTSGG